MPVLAVKVLLHEYMEPLLRRFHLDCCARAFRSPLRRGKGVPCGCFHNRPLQNQRGVVSMTFDLYTEVTNQIVAMLDQGVVPWRSPILGRGSAGDPKNMESTKPYRGVNVFLLAFSAFAKGYGSSYWLTFKQALAKGGAVKKGEK